MRLDQSFFRNSYLPGFTVIAAVLSTGCSQDIGDHGLNPVAPDSSLEITSPEAGSFNSRTEIHVGGLSEAIENLEMNGEAVEVKNHGNFGFDTELITGMNSFEFTATGLDGVEYLERRTLLNGRYIDADQTLENSVGVFLGKDGLASLGSEAADMIDPENLTEYLVAMNPVYTDTVQIEWAVIDLGFYIDQITFDNVEVKIVPSDDMFQVEVDLRNTFVDGRVLADLYGLGLIDDDFEFDLMADTSRLFFDVTPSLVDGEIQIEPAGGRVQFDGFVYDIGGLSDVVEGYVYVEEIRDLVEGALYSEVETIVVPIVEEAMSGFELASQIDVAGTTMALDGELSWMKVTDEGMSLRMDIDLDVPRQRSVENGFLASSEASPEFDLTAAAETVISDNLLNLALYRLWEGGAFDVEYSTADGNIDNNVTELIGSDDVAMTVTPILPPVILNRGNTLMMEFGEVEVEIETGDTLGTTALWVVSGSTEVKANIADGMLNLEFVNPETSVVVRENEMGLGVLEATLAVETLGTLDMVADIFSGVRLPMPSIPGVVLDGAKHERAGDESQSAFSL